MEAPFNNAYAKVRKSTYALIAWSSRKTRSCGTAFMIAPGVLATVAHVLYRQAGDSSSFQETIAVIRDPEINTGQLTERAEVLAVDAEYDIGLLRIKSPRTITPVDFATGAVQPATSVGTVGYPLMDLDQIIVQQAVPLLRFQAGCISAIYGKKSPASARRLDYIETDMPMYKGSSGAPGFLASGDVFGMHVASWHDEGSEEKPGQRAFSMWIPSSAVISLARGNDIKIST